MHQSSKQVSPAQLQTFLTSLLATSFLKLLHVSNILFLAFLGVRLAFAAPLLGLNSSLASPSFPRCPTRAWLCLLSSTVYHPDRSHVSSNLASRSAHFDRLGALIRLNFEVPVAKSISLFFVSSVVFQLILLNYVPQRLPSPRDSSCSSLLLNLLRQQVLLFSSSDVCHDFFTHPCAIPRSSFLCHFAVVLTLGHQYYAQ